MPSPPLRCMMGVAAGMVAIACLVGVAAEPAAPTHEPARLLHFRDDAGREQPVRTPADWQQRRSQILAGMQAVLGEMPERSNLPTPTIEVLDEVRERTFTRQSILLKVDEHDRVPAYLYLPNARAPGARLAAILALHQTTPLGKKEVDGQGTADQKYARELALRGYVVLAPDYPSFGDYACDFTDKRFASGTMKGVYNHSRCVDFLVSREEVDPERLGVIGHSLGGHNSMFLAAFDERLKAIVSCCGWTPMHDYYDGRLDAWAQPCYMPRIRDVYGLDADRLPFDFYEVVAAFAPRAFLSISPLRDDNFAVGGVKKAIPAAAEVYKLLGVESNLQARYPDCAHSFPDAERTAAYDFLALHLRARSQDAKAGDADELPRFAPLEPKDAVKSFSLLPGFRIEQVAAEPLVHSPVALDFEESGRMYVAEMIDYSEQDKEALGAIRLLEDTDHDGRFDKSTLFADHLSWPTAVICYDGGVFVGMAPDIVYFKDENCDGKADVRKTVFTGFGRGNVQGLLNSFCWGIDLRIHGATSTNGGLVRRAEAPENTAINLNGRDFSFDPRKLDLRAESGGGQHGMTFDDWGHKFICSNSDHLQMIVMEDRYASRNPAFTVASTRQSVATDGPSAEIFRTSPVEPWRELRTKMRVSGKASGPIEHGGKSSGYFSGASGVLAYRGNEFPAECRNQVFIVEPCAGLIHRKAIEPQGVSFVGKRIDDKREFAASSDTWCRPVQLANSPDGALYVIDMYREVIEHPWSLPPEIKQRIDLTSGRDRGRIYRIVPDQLKHSRRRPCEEFDSRSLVGHLAHRNGWRQAKIARILAQRGDATSELERLIEARGHSPEARLYALYILAATDRLKKDLALRATLDPDLRVREHAVRLTERFKDDAEVLRSLCMVADEADLRVRYQLAFTLGEFPSTDKRNAALAKIAKRDGADPLVRTAILTSLAEGAGFVLADVLRDRAFCETPHGRAFLDPVAAIVGTQHRADDLKRLDESIAAEGAGDAAIAAVLTGFLRGRAKAPADQRQSLSKSVESAIDRVTTSAVGTACDESQPLEARVQAVRLFAHLRQGAIDKICLQLLTDEEPPELQIALIETLDAYADPQLGAVLTAQWPHLTPRLRTAAGNAIFSRTEWLAIWLDAVIAGNVAINEIEPARLQMLAARTEPAIQSRYQQLAARTKLGPRQEVIDAYRPALSLRGDAAKGKTHFQKNCSACHRLENAGHEIGPNLATFKTRGPEAILLNVLDPNREVNPQFMNYVASLSDGRSISGMIANETAASITLKRAENAIDVVARDDIEELQSTRQSIMPEGFEKQLDQQALADVIAYLMTVN